NAGLLEQSRGKVRALVRNAAEPDAGLGETRKRFRDGRVERAADEKMALVAGRERGEGGREQAFGRLGLIVVLVRPSRASRAFPDVHERAPDQLIDAVADPRPGRDLGRAG